MNQRPNDYNKDDLIIGKFLGDSELLMMNNEGVYIVDPIYPRSEWTKVTKKLEQFFMLYFENKGEKFWEV